MSEAGRELVIPTVGEVPALVKGVGADKAKEATLSASPAKATGEAVAASIAGLGEIADTAKVQAFANRRAGSKLDVSAALDKLTPNEGEHEQASGGIGAALFDLASATTDRVQKLIATRIQNRDRVALIELQPEDRVETVAVLREQRAARLRESQARGEGVADRARRAQFQRDRAGADGKTQANGQGERRHRANGERARTVDGGTLHPHRTPHGQQRAAGVRSLADARRSIAAPGRTIEGQSRMLGVTPKGLGPAVTGVARPMRLAQPMPGPAKLNIAPPQMVNHGAPAMRGPQQGLGQQRGPAMAVMSSIASGIGQGIR